MYTKRMSPISISSPKAERNRANFPIVAQEVEDRQLLRQGAEQIHRAAVVQAALEIQVKDVVEIPVAQGAAFQLG